MISTDEHRFFIPAWGISLALHGVVVVLALIFATHVTPVLQKDVFQWDIVLVETTKSESVPNHAQSGVTPEQPSAQVMPQPRPKRVTEVAQAVKPLEQKIEPPPAAIEQKIETPQVREEPMEQHLVEMAEPKPEPIIEAKAPEPVEAQPAQQESVADATTSALSHEAVAQPEAPAEAPPRETDVDTALVQVAQTSLSGPKTKVDHRWLAESLWRRVAELKRYPNSARMNGQEGKVILKAVIRSDGQLADVSVQKSSGYSALDAAAIEAVRLACPLHMKRAIGKPQIVVSLPIVYSLAN